MRGNTKVAINHCLLVLLLAVASLGGCKADEVRTANGNVMGVERADFGKLANHTLLVSMERSDVRAIGGNLPPESVLPLTVGALPNIVTTAIPTQKQSCRLVGLAVETDNRQETQEWLAMQDKSCSPTSPHGWRDFWMLQQDVDGTVRVLLSDKAHSVKLMEWTKEAKTDSPRQRPISVTRAGRTCPTCGSTNCEGVWQNKTGSYQRPSQFLVERTHYDSMSGLDQSLTTEGSCPLD